MLAKSREDRPQSFTAVAAELEAILAAYKYNSQIRQVNMPTSPAGADDAEPGEDQPQTPTGAKNLALLIGAIALLSIGALLLPQFFKPPELPKLSHTHTSVLADTKVEYPRSPERTPSKNHPTVPYLQNRGTDWRSIRHFVFFPEVNLGQLGWTAQNTYTDAQALGEVTVPAGRTLHLMANETLADTPEFFNGFGANDLDELNLHSSAGEWNNSHLKHIVQCKSLAGLIVNRDTGISDDCIDDLNELPNLSRLYVDNTSITGAGLTRLKRLNQLATLSAAGLKSMPIALKKLNHNNTIKILALIDCKLTDNDVAPIAGMTALTSLRLGQNSKLTNNALAKLDKLKHLEYLYIRGTGVTDSCVEILKRFPALHVLSIDYENWSPAQQTKLKESLRQCRLEPPQKKRPPLELKDF